MRRAMPGRYTGARNDSWLVTISYMGYMSCMARWLIPQRLVDLRVLANKACFPQCKHAGQHMKRIQTLPSVPGMLAIMTVWAAHAELQPATSGPTNTSTQGRPLTVKVAAIQCSSDIGEVKRNREKLRKLVEDAAANGAKIIVLPEAAITGYL